MIAHSLTSKLLLLEHEPSQVKAIREFCADRNLSLLATNADDLAAHLLEHTDLGAVLCSEHFMDSPQATAELLREIRAERPELPILLRQDSVEVVEELALICQAIYSTGQLDTLDAAIDEYIHCLRYPTTLIAEIPALSMAALSSQIPRYQVTHAATSIVRDRQMSGTMLSLIPLESAWCRGFMLMQADEKPLLQALSGIETGHVATDFRSALSALGEITNLIWGAFKNRFIGDAAAWTGSNIQVPLLINRPHGYISFGTENPQLCFRYTLQDESSQRCFDIDQRFIFNLHWAPEDFKERSESNEQGVEAGGLELF